MNTSTTINQLAPALLQAQAKIGAAKKEATNPFYHTKYADLGAVMEACKEALNESKIFVLQPVMDDKVETYLIHESGEWMSSSTPIVCKEQNNPQALGSAISYARRYGLQSMVFIPAEDDDGNSAVPSKAAPSVSPAKSAPAAVSPDKCPACGATGKFHKPGCPRAIPEGSTQ